MESSGQTKGQGKPAGVVAGVVAGLLDLPPEILLQILSCLSPFLLSPGGRQAGSAEHERPS